MRIRPVENETVVTIIECHVLDACIGGDGASQCSPGYAGSRWEHAMWIVAVASRTNPLVHRTSSPLWWAQVRRVRLGLLQALRKLQDMRQRGAGDGPCDRGSCRGGARNNSFHILGRHARALHVSTYTSHPHASRCCVAATSGLRYLSVIPLCDMVRVSHPSLARRCLGKLFPTFTLLSVHAVSADTDAWDLGRCGSSLSRDDSLCNHRGSAF